MDPHFLVEEAAIWSEKQDAMQDQWIEIKQNIRSSSNQRLQRRPVQRRRSTSDTFTVAIGEWELDPRDGGLVEQVGILPESQAWRRAQYAMEESWAVVRRELEKQMREPNQVARQFADDRITARLKRQSKGLEESAIDPTPVKEVRENGTDDSESEVEITPIKQMLIDELNHQGKRSALKRQRKRQEQTNQDLYPLLLSSPLLDQTNIPSQNSPTTKQRTARKAKVRKLVRRTGANGFHVNRGLENDVDASLSSRSSDRRVRGKSRRHRGVTDGGVPDKKRRWNDDERASPDYDYFQGEIHRRPSESEGVIASRKKTKVATHSRKTTS